MGVVVYEADLTDAGVKSAGEATRRSTGPKRGETAQRRGPELLDPLRDARL